VENLNDQDQGEGKDNEVAQDHFEGEDDDSGQPGQTQPAQGQPNFGNQQPQNFNSSQNYTNSQQPPYPPREQPQPYGGQLPNSNHYQSRPQHQPQQHQPYSPPQQHQQPPQPAAAATDAGQLPSFITGSQPQQIAQAPETNGYDNQGGDRYPRHRRRRHRGPGGPRPDLPNMPQEFHGDDGNDAPGNT